MPSSNLSYVMSEQIHHSSQRQMPTILERRRHTLLQKNNNCMKSRNFWSGGGGGCVPGVRPLDSLLCVTTLTTFRWKELFLQLDHQPNFVSVSTEVYQLITQILNLSLFPQTEGKNPTTEE